LISENLAKDILWMVKMEDSKFGSQLQLPSEFKAAYVK
jgi:hypothetical protein